MTALAMDVRTLSIEEIDAVSGAGLREFLAYTKRVMDQVPEEAKFIGAIGVGALAGAPAGPIGAAAGAVIAGGGYILSQ